MKTICRECRFHNARCFDGFGGERNYCNRVCKKFPMISKNEKLEKNPITGALIYEVKEGYECLWGFDPYEYYKKCDLINKDGNCPYFEEKTISTRTIIGGSFLILALTGAGLNWFFNRKDKLREK